MSHRATTLAILTTSALLLGGSQALAGQAQPGGGVHIASAVGTFTGFSPSATAVTYDHAQVPRGALAGVFSFAAPQLGTGTTLTVTGLVPDREYGAHVHTKPCGTTGKAAGPHFQHVPAPDGSSGDPAYANPHNEIWLDFTTDTRGNGVATARVEWLFDERRAHSVVIHERHTSTAPGKAGEAGSRLACVNVDF